MRSQTWTFPTSTVATGYAAGKIRQIPVFLNLSSLSSLHAQSIAFRPLRAPTIQEAHAQISRVCSIYARKTTFRVLQSVKDPCSASYLSAPDRIRRIPRYITFVMV